MLQLVKFSEKNETSELSMLEWYSLVVQCQFCSYYAWESMARTTESDIFLQANSMSKDLQNPFVRSAQKLTQLMLVPAHIYLNLSMQFLPCRVSLKFKNAKNAFFIPSFRVLPKGSFRNQIGNFIQVTQATNRQVQFPKIQSRTKA